MYFHIQYNDKSGTYDLYDLTSDTTIRQFAKDLKEIKLVNVTFNGKTYIRNRTKIISVCLSISDSDTEHKDWIKNGTSLIVRHMVPLRHMFAEPQYFTDITNNY